MKYKISTNNLEPLLKIIHSNSRFIVTKNIFKIFMEYNFHQVNNDEQINKLIPILINYYDTVKTSKQEVDSEELFKNLLEKYHLDETFIYKTNISNLNNLILLEGDNLGKINAENFSFIKDVIYRTVNVTKNFVELEVIADRLDFKSEKDYWLLQSLLISQDINIEKTDDKVILNGPACSIYISGNNLENYFEKLEVINNLNEAKIIEDSLFNSPIDMSLFTSVVNKYLSEKTDEQMFLTLGDKVEFLLKKLNDNNIEDVLFQLNDVLKEGGYDTFKDANVLNPYVSIILKAKEIDAQVDVNYVSEKNADFFHSIPLYIQFPIFSEDTQIRKNLVNKLSVEKFYELATGSNPINFAKNPSSTEMENLAKIVMSKILKVINNSVNPEKGYSQKMKSIRNIDLNFKSGDVLRKLDWYSSAILMEKNLESSSYWEGLRKFFVLGEKNPDKLKLHSYSYAYEDVEVAFEIISQGLNIISLLKNKQSLNIKHIEDLINIKPINLNDSENKELSIDVLKVVDSLQYLLEKESVQQSDILNINLNKYFLLSSTKSYAKDLLDYKSIVQNFLNGSKSPRDDLFLGFRPSKLLEYGSVDKLKEITGYLVKLVNLTNSGELFFHNKIVGSIEELVQLLLLDGNDKQKEAGFILSQILPQITTFNVNLDLDKKWFKKYFIKYMYELEDSAYHLNPSDRIWDLNEDGTLKTNDSNIEIFDLCLGKDGLLNYVTGNKEFLKNPNVVNSYINHLINKQTASFKVNKLWSKIYSEVGSDFFDNLWINISKDKTIDDIGNKFNPGLLGSLKYSTIGDNKIEVKELVTFMLSSHKDLPKILLSKEVIFDNKFLKVAGFFSNGDWYKKIPAEYYRHPNAMSILELLNYGDMREKDLLSSIPKEILITPKNILNVLKKSTNKLEALKVISLELYDYCAINNINEEQVTEKIEIIFNAMIIDKIALTNKPQSKKNFKF